MLQVKYARWLPLVAMLLFIAPRANADINDTFGISLSSNYMYDSNVFRLSDRTNPLLLLGTPSKADQVITSSATIRFDKRYSLQRFQLDGSLVDTRYLNFDTQSFTAFNYKGNWAWSLTPRFYGNLSFNHREMLNSFASLTGFSNFNTRNKRIDDDYSFNGVYEIDGVWRLVGGVSHVSRKNTQTFTQEFNNTVQSAEGGIRYAFPSGSSLTYKFKYGFGEYQNRPQPIVSSLFDNRFNDAEHDMRLVWPVTGKTSISAHLGHLERKHDHFSQRDFSGLIGGVDVNWNVTGKTQLSLIWSHELSNFQTARFQQFINTSAFSSSYMVSDRLTIMPVWKITSDINLRLRYDFINRDFRGAVVSIPRTGRVDGIHTGSVTLEWQPLKEVMLSATFQRDHRSSSLPGFDYDSTMGSVAVRLNL